MKPKLTLTQIVDALGDKIPQFAKKHPALLAGGAGVGLGLANVRGPAQVVENSIMNEYVGAPTAKYSSCESLEKFAERKRALAARRNAQEMLPSTKRC